MANCASCSATIENESVTGILCQACYTRDVQPRAAWKEYVSGPVAMGLLLIGGAFVFSVRVNGIDYGGLGCAAIALLCGFAGLLQANKNEPGFRTKRMIGSALVIGLAVVRLLMLAAPMMA
jgi:hypothetical protein